MKWVVIFTTRLLMEMGCHFHNAFARGSGLSFLQRGCLWKWVVIFTTRLLVEVGCHFYNAVARGNGLSFSQSGCFCTGKRAFHIHCIGRRESAVPPEQLKTLQGREQLVKLAGMLRRVYW
jgi:hypothetical protein